MFSIKGMSLKQKFYSVAIVAVISMLSISIFANVIQKAANPSSIQEERSYQIYEGNVPKEAIEFVEVKNLQSSLFPGDFEIKIKNIGKKPIYGVFVVISFPNARVNGRALGYDMYYGDEMLGNVNTLAKPTDSSIQVGEIGTLKMSAASAKAFKKAIEQGIRAVSSTYKMLIILQTINYGDGTGYICRDPYPGKRKISSVSSKSQFLFSDRFVGASRITALSLLEMRESVNSLTSCQTECDYYHSEAIFECCYTPKQYIWKARPGGDPKRYCELGIECWDEEGYGPYYCYQDILYNCEGISPCP